MQKVLIVFTDKYLSYSPTTLNIYDGLKNKGFDVAIVSAKQVKHFSATDFKEEKIKFIGWKSLENVSVFQKLVRKVSRWLKPPDKLLSEKAKSFISEIQSSEANRFIAIDFFALWCLQAAGKKAFVVSLEIYEVDPYYQAVNFEQIEGAIIQSTERYEYIFNNKPKPPFYLVQNAPPFLDIPVEPLKRNKYQLIYCGTTYLDFGIISCLEFTKDYPEYSLTVIGAVPPDTQDTIDQFHQELIDSGRLKIDKNYYDLNTLTQIISTFRIGLVFYDIYHYLNLRKFNTYSIPSGKLYQYFNSGLPVIGNKLSGFAVVEENRAGVLIPYLSTLQIKNAIDTIEADYENYALNAKKVSKLMDSKVAIDKLIDQAFM